MNKDQLEKEYQQFCVENNLDGNLSPEEHIGGDRNVMLWLEKHIEARRMVILSEMKGYQYYTGKPLCHSPASQAALLSNMATPNQIVH